LIRVTKGNFKLLRKVVLSLGGNIGDVESNLQLVKSALNEHFKCLVNCSKIYQTKAWGNENQPDFLNQVVYFETEYTLLNIFSICRLIEKNLGRERKSNIKWGPRNIDIDLLFCGDLILESKNLNIPHPQLHKRNFVLTPLLEILPDLAHPKFKTTVKELSQSCTDTLNIIEY